MRRYLLMRRRRVDFLGSDLFADPAWDILLDLFAASREGLDISVSSACIASGVPCTTATAWVRKLEDCQLVRREADPRDGRRTFLRLTKLAEDRLEDWLSRTFLG